MKKTITLAMILAAASAIYGLTLVYGSDKAPADRNTDGLFIPPVDKSWEDATFSDEKVDPLWVALGYRGNNPQNQKTDADGKAIVSEEVTAARAAVAPADAQTIAERVREVQSGRVRWLLGVPAVGGMLVVFVAIGVLLFRRQVCRTDFARGLIVAEIKPAAVVLERNAEPNRETKGEPAPVRRAA